MAELIFHRGRFKEIKPVMARSSESNNNADQALFNLYESGQIGYETAIRHADSANNLRLRIKLESKRPQPQLLGENLLQIEAGAAAHLSPSLYLAMASGAIYDAESKLHPLGRSAQQVIGSIAGGIEQIWSAQQIGDPQSACPGLASAKHLTGTARNSRSRRAISKPSWHSRGQRRQPRMGDRRQWRPVQQYATAGGGAAPYPPATGATAPARAARRSQ